MRMFGIVLEMNNGEKMKRVEGPDFDAVEELPFETTTGSNYHGNGI